MVWVHRSASMFRYLFQKDRLEEELDAELHSYMDMLMDRYVAGGMSREAARRAAEREFESFHHVRERVREVRIGTTIESGLQDMRHAGRGLRRSPSFTAIAVLTLALGIGVNTAIFSVVHAELLRPLPYSRPEQLVTIWSDFAKSGADRAPASGPLVREIEQRSRTLQTVAGIWVGNGTFTGEDNPEQVKLASVTTNFLAMLGVRPVLGRVFLPEEKFGGRPAIVLSYGFWKRRFGGDPNIVGKGVAFQGASATVLGVLPEDFQLYFPKEANVPGNVQAYVPFGNIYRAPLTLYYIRVVARMKPGFTITQAQQDLDVVADQIRGAFTEFAAEKLQFHVVSMHGDAVREIRPALIALFAGAGFVLLICCTNVANLLLARASDSRREIALRSALGASPRRIVWQLFSEGLILCAMGGVAGLALGWAGVRWLVHLRPDHLARIGDVGLNWQVLAFVAGASLLSVMIFGLMPSLQLGRWDVMQTLREARNSQTTTGRGLRGALIVCEITLGFVLVIGAGLMIRTFANIHRLRPGFEPRQLLTFEVEFSGRRYPGNALLTFVKQWEDRVRSLPGVESVGAISHLPLDDYPNWYSPYRPENVPENEASGLVADHRCVTPGYLQAMGTRLLAGRMFDEQDRLDGRQVVIVDELLARAAWPGQSAVGKKLESEHFTSRGIVPVMAEVVGVVEHIRNHSLSQEVRPEVYIPFEQSARTHLSFVVRTRVDPLSLAGAIRQELHQRDPQLAVSKIRPMAEYVERAAAPMSFTARLAGLFAALALVLAAIGIYGVVYYSVSQRMHEMGVRIALGASARDVMRLVMREGLRLTGIGILLGVSGSLVVSHSLRSLVFGISATDPLTYGLALAVIPAAAMLGCWRPAAKAARVNPLDAIRAE